jgi:hypothetical protein
MKSTEGASRGPFPAFFERFSQERILLCRREQQKRSNLGREGRSQIFLHTEGLGAT